MDPTTTLVTFMLQTPPYIQSVDLIGSWDNFTRHYPMERDVRRARGQWRGCYAFEDIICDGDGGNSSIRSGGLKMGSTYYYYFEVDGNTEHHDASQPSTTTCPFLPGQPVNLLSVPVEVQPQRLRCASMSSMADGHVKTMNPADKFVTPRPPPAPPVTLRRLNTSPTLPTLQKKRSTRSLSPKYSTTPKREKVPSSPWSPKTFFGRRTPHPSLPAPERDSRGRTSSISSNESMEGDANIGYPVLISGSGTRKVRSVPQTRDASPLSSKTCSVRESIREPSRQSCLSESTSHHDSFLIPDEIVEEDNEDDDNWATQLSRMSFNSEPHTSLSPPPSSINMRSSASSTSGRQTPPTPLRRSMDKPLPELPESPVLPPSLHLNTLSPDLMPRSHFSTSTISTSFTSPTDSHFGFSDSHSPSISDFNDDYQKDLLEADDDFTYAAIGNDRSFSAGFNGYSLPDGEYASEQTLRKESSSDGQHSSRGRMTFNTSAERARESLNVLEQFMNDMGYLGDHIAK